jgi:ParB family transcriptional regulator, chromosome partitioning protein
MAKKSHGLGRGLDALLPTEEDLEAGLQQINIGDIDPNTDQPRRAFPEEGLEQLAQSIRDQGVLQPIIVVPQTGGRYRIVAGERRWRACRMAGLDTVPCIVRDLDIIQQQEIALLENMQREDLNPIEAATGIRALMRQCGYTQEAVAQRLSMSRPAVANMLRLLSLPQDVQDLITKGQLSAGHARVLAGLDDANTQSVLAKETVEKGYSVRQLEELAAQLKGTQLPGGKKPPRKPHQMPVELTELQERIRETMGIRATLTGNAKKGRIVLNYYSAEELEHLNDLLLRLEEM